jgi:hypothetical protein
MIQMFPKLFATMGYGIIGFYLIFHHPLPFLPRMPKIFLGRYRERIQAANSDIRDLAYRIANIAISFKLYALDTTLSLPKDVTKAKVQIACQGHILDQAELIGVYDQKR